MKLTLSPFASRIRSPGLSRPCLSMNESMMILATITWVHFLKNSFSKKQKSEAAELTLSKCAGLVSIPNHLHDIIWCILHNQKIFLFVLMDSAQQVGFSNTGSGRVWGKIPGSRLDLGRVVVLKYTIRYFQVFFKLEYFQVFLGIFRYLFTHGYSGYIRYHLFFWRQRARYWGFLLSFIEGILWRNRQPLTKSVVILYLKYPVMSGNSRNVGFTWNIR